MARLGMKLAIVAPFPPNPQGEANYTGQFVRALMPIAKDAQIAIFAQRHSGSSSQETLCDQVQIHRILERDTFWGRNVGCWRLFRALRRFQPDILHLEGGLLPDYGGKFGEPLIVLLALLRASGVRLVVSAHSTWRLQDIHRLGRSAGFPSIVSHWITSYYRLLLRAFYSRFHSINIVVSGHEPPIATQYIEEYDLDRSKSGFEPHPCRYAPASDEVREQAKAGFGLAGRLGPQDAGERHAEGGERPDADEIAPGDAVAPDRPSREVHVEHLQTLRIGWRLQA